MKKLFARILIMVMVTSILTMSDGFLFETTDVYAAVRLNKKSTNIIKGQKVKLKILGTKKKAKWSSSKKSVAVVNNKGVVTAKKKGKAKITAKIGNTAHVHKGNKITISYNGSIAEAFYQAEPFWATDDVNILTLKDYKLNVYIAMFLITLFRMEKYRFNYGRKWDKESMSQSKIKLPTTSGSVPDWQFMENYIKSLPYSKNL